MEDPREWSDERHAAAKALCEKASCGPWKWREDQFRPKYMQRVKRPKGGRAKDWVTRPGRRSADSWLMLLTSPRKNADPDWVKTVLAATEDDVVHGKIDEFDFHHIIAIRWNMIRGTSVFNAAPHDGDKDFIEQARTELPAALAEIERLKMLLAATEAARS